MYRLSQTELYGSVGGIDYMPYLLIVLSQLLLLTINETMLVIFY